MKDINYVKAMAQNCIEEMNAIGLYPQITADDFSINSRIQKTLGRCWCKRQNGKTKYTIEISTRMLGDNVLEEGLRLVTLHELCHASDITFKDGHTGKWKEWAELVSDCYAVDIQRCTPTAKYNVPPRKIAAKKPYKWMCSGCGKEFTAYKAREPKWYKHPQGYTHRDCPCGKGYVMSEYYGFKLV